MVLRLLVILLFILSTNVSAEALSPKLREILAKTMAIDGYLNKDMHQQFWLEVKQLGGKDEIELLKNTSILPLQEYQKELWESARISYENKRVVKTERLIHLEKEIPIMFEKSLTSPKGSANYQRAMSTYKNETKAGTDNSSRLLHAAAARSYMTAAQGQVIPLDMNMINSVLANLESSFLRITNLLNENWDGQ